MLRDTLSLVPSSDASSEPARKCVLHSSYMHAMFPAADWRREESNAP